MSRKWFNLDSLRMAAIVLMLVGFICLALRRDSLEKQESMPSEGVELDSSSDDQSRLEFLVLMNFANVIQKSIPSLETPEAPGRLNDARDYIRDVCNLNKGQSLSNNPVYRQRYVELLNIYFKAQTFHEGHPTTNRIADFQAITTREIEQVKSNIRASYFVAPGT